MQDNDKDFKDYIETLPPELKQAIYSIDYPKKLQEVVKNNKLMIDQAGKLEAETTLVMAGIEPMNKYLGNLVVNVGLSSAQASLVAHDVNELIFKNIREALKQINDQILEEDKIIAETEKVQAFEKEPTKEEVLEGIEHPENIKENEQSISISSLKSNNVGIEMPKFTSNSIVEVRPDILPEQINPAAILPVVSSVVPKPPYFHKNISPVSSVTDKLNTPVVLPKETVVIKMDTKLPEKNKLSGDPYREAVI